MATKINPNGLRMGINKNWNSRWYPKNKTLVAKWINEDGQIRKYFFNNYPLAQIDKIEIERKNENTILINIHACQPGVIIGKNSDGIKKNILEINKIVGRKITVNINVVTFGNFYWSARNVAREIADSIAKQISFRTAQKNAIKRVMNSKILGIKTKVSGRLGGVDMARTEGYSEGCIPLSTIRSDIDYACEESNTKFGKIGVKVWLNKGEIFKKGLNNQIPVYVSDNKQYRGRKK